MGAADEAIVTVDLSTATKKERQFQVVPVPGHFTRGRWKCWDYRDEKIKEQNDGEKERSDTLSMEISTIVITASATTVPEIEPLDTEIASALDTTPIKDKESTTFLVTSIAAHPNSHNGTPVKQSDIPVIATQLSHTLPEESTASGQQNVVISIPADIHVQQVSVGVTTQQAPALPTVSSAPSAMVGRSDGIPPDDDGSTSSNGAPMPNIDNKIEQAMDLVKTHLTFAVREEIEVLRQTIVELESKVGQLEGENQLLRQYAPAEIVSNISALVAQQKNQAGTSAVATASSVAASKVASSYCTQTFANHLTNVVSDVRNQFRTPDS